LTTFPAYGDGDEILLVDEVNVFFGSDFYGQTHNQVAVLAGGSGAFEGDLEKQGQCSKSACFQPASL
jgi:hypothetical protein